MRAQIQSALAAVALALSAPAADARNLQPLALGSDPSGALTVEIEIEGQPRLVHFAPHSLRSPSFTLLVDRGHGPQAEPAPPEST